MDRGVLLVSQRGKDYECMIDEAFGLNVPLEFYPLSFSISDPEFAQLRGRPPAVRPAGDKLYKALVAHEPVRALFASTSVLPSGPSPARIFPLYIRIGTPEAEALPWETLYEQQKTFMVLDPQGRWPIGRLASPPRRAEPLDRAIGAELRVAIVLGAAQEKGVGDWNAIAAAVDKLRAPADLLVLVSEEETKDAVIQKAQTWNGLVPARRVQVEYISNEAPLTERLRAHAPNVVHFFCHGVAAAQPQLEVETRADRRGPNARGGKDARGSILLNSTMLEELARAHTLWLVVLNCCQGAAAASQLHSLARNLVAAGIPAVVAMRESVDVRDANLFAEHFYPQLFAQLQPLFEMRDNPAVPKPLPLQEIVWMRAVHEARLQLSRTSGRNAESSVEWTYPVVYVHRDSVRLQPRELSAAAALPPAIRNELLAKLDVLRQVRATLVPESNADPAQREKLDRDITQIEMKLTGS